MAEGNSVTGNGLLYLLVRMRSFMKVSLGIHYHSSFEELRTDEFLEAAHGSKCFLREMVLLVVQGLQMLHC